MATSTAGKGNSKGQIHATLPLFKVRQHSSMGFNPSLPSNQISENVELYNKFKLRISPIISHSLHNKHGNTSRLKSNINE